MDSELAKLEQTIIDLSTLIYNNDYDNMISHNNKLLKKLDYHLMTYINKCANIIKSDASDTMLNKIMNGLVKYCYLDTKRPKNNFFYILNVLKYLQNYYKDLQSHLLYLPVEDYVRNLSRTDNIDYKYDDKELTINIDDATDKYGLSSPDNELKMTTVLKCGLFLADLISMVNNVYHHKHSVKIVFERYINKKSVKKAIQALPDDISASHDGNITYIDLKFKDEKITSEHYVNICEYVDEYEYILEKLRNKSILDSVDFGQPIEPMDVVLDNIGDVNIFDYKN